MSDRCNIEIKFGGTLDDSQVTVIAQALAIDGGDRKDWIEEQIRATDTEEPFAIELTQIPYGAAREFENAMEGTDLSYEVHINGDSNIAEAYVLFIDGVRHYTEVSLGAVVVPLSYLEEQEKAGATLTEVVADYTRFDRKIPPLVIVRSARERIALDIVGTQSSKTTEHGQAKNSKRSRRFSKQVF